MQPKILDLDDILVTPAVVEKWQFLCELWKHRLAKAGVSPDDIPDEQFALYPQGHGYIFVKVGRLELAMRVEKGEFALVRDN